MADLTINYQREMVVDFTMPFLDLGKSDPLVGKTFQYSLFVRFVRYRSRIVKEKKTSKANKSFLLAKKAYIVNILLLFQFSLLSAHFFEHTIFNHFFSSGISVLFVKAPEKAVNLFSFLSPLSANVWILMILAGVAVSLAMFFVGRFVILISY